jgi:hypothetical protein
LGAARPPAYTGPCPGIVQYLFDLVIRSAVLGNVLNVAVWIVFQVPKDRNLNHNTIL